MANGLLAFTGGLATGVGMGMVEKGRQDREDRIREVVAARQDRHRVEDRANAVSDREDTQSFQSGERAAGQDFTADQNAANRDFTRSERIGGQNFTSGENDANRSHQSNENAANRDFTAGQNDKNREHDKTMNDVTVADVITGGDGKLHAVTRSGGTRPILDSNGNGLSPDQSERYQDTLQRVLSDLIESNASQYGEARKSNQELLREAESLAADMLNGKQKDSGDAPVIRWEMNEDGTLGPVS